MLSLSNLTQISEHEAVHGRANRSVTLLLPKSFKEKETSRVTAKFVFDVTNVQRPTLSRRPKLSRRGLGLEDLKYVYKSACEHYKAVPLEQMNSCLAVTISFSFSLHGNFQQSAANGMPPNIVSLEGSYCCTLYFFEPRIYHSIRLRNANLHFISVFGQGEPDPMAGASGVSFEQFLAVCEVLIQNAGLRSLDLTGAFSYHTVRCSSLPSPCTCISCMLSQKVCQNLDWVGGVN